MDPTEHADRVESSQLNPQSRLIVETASYPIALIDEAGTWLASSPAMTHMVAQSGVPKLGADWAERCKHASRAPRTEEIVLYFGKRSVPGTLSAMSTSHGDLFLLQLPALDQAILDAFSYGIHDARTELQSISASAGLMSEIDQASDAVKTNLSDQIIRASGAVLEILNDMLAAVPSRYQRPSEDKGTYSVGEVIKEIACRLEPLAQRQGSHIRFPTNHSALCSAKQRRSVESIVRNLVGNAIKSTPNGVITIDLNEEALGTPDYYAVTIEVTDTGYGMSAEDRNYLLNSDTRGPSTQHEGRRGGVGSRIIHSALADLDGKMTVESGSQTGTHVTVTFRLPVNPAAEPAAEHLSPIPNGAPDLAALQNARILIVEDNDTNRTLFVHLLSKSGARAEAVENGDLALDRLAFGGPVDLLLMDLSMPVKDGLDLACALLAGNPETGPTLVGLSGEIDERWRTACRRSGMKDVLLKPISPGSLRQRLADLLAERETSGPEASPPVVAQHMVEDLYEDLGRDETRRLMRQALAQTAALVARIEREGFADDIYKEIHSALGALGLTGLARLDDRLRIVQAVSRVKPMTSPAMQDVMDVLRKSLAETTTELDG